MKQHEALPYLLLAAAALSPFTSAHAQDWPNYNGPDHRRQAVGQLDPGAWGGKGPVEAWRTATPGGFSSFCVAQGRAYTIVSERHEGETREALVALIAGSGQLAWRRLLGPAEYDRGGDKGAEGNEGGDGPRSTPAYAGGAVYVYDAHFRLTCVDASSGEVRWQRDVRTECDGRTLKWGNASAPLIDGGRVFVAGGGAGQSMLAFDARTGETVWKTGDEQPTHATPVVAELHGERHLIFYMQSGLVALSPKDGHELWRGEFPYKTSSAASPVVQGNLVYVSAGYGVGAGVYEIGRGSDGYRPELLWIKRNRLINHWSTPVCKGGKLYGLYGFKKYGEAPLACVDLRTGELEWEHPGFGPGNCILVGEHLVVLSDAGEAVLVDPVPGGYRELGRADVLKGKCWSSPAYADGKLFLRSTEEAVCLRVARG